MLKVLLVDGHLLTAKGIQDLIEHEPDLELSGGCTYGTECARNHCNAPTGSRRFRR